MLDYRAMPAYFAGVTVYTVSGMTSAAIEHLKRLVSRPDDEVDLAEAALVIAQDEYPQLDVAEYLRRLDTLAEDVRARLLPDASPEHTIATFNHFFYRELGFAGNADDYYDPRNSYLNEVLDRRLGIPITLAILYIEIGRRLGLQLQGVSFPAHFLVKLPLTHGTIVLDPYAGGISLSEENLRERLLQVYGEHAPDVSLEQVLASADKKEILARILRNLKAIYLSSENFTKALSAVDRLLIVNPGAAEELRDRGLLYERLECAHAALADFGRYLELAPEARDAQDVRDRIVELRQQADTLH